jgi:hypothetical protein
MGEATAPRHWLFDAHRRSGEREKVKQEKERMGASSWSSEKP